MAMLISCCLIILAMYLDIFALSVVLPAAACDFGLTTSQQGAMSAMPLMGVMVSSYAWGLCVDTIGRRKTLLIAMPIGILLNIATSVASSFAYLATLKFLSATFTSSANAAAFVLLGESASRRYRSRCMFLMASATMCSQLIICAIALPVFSARFSIPISWLNMEYRPWHLLLLMISLPGVFGVVGIAVLCESPKFLLSKGQEKNALKALKCIYIWNTRSKGDFPVTALYLDDTVASTDTKQNDKVSFIRKMWDQTAPLFKPPLLKNSAVVYYLLLCAYMTSTGFTMWIPTIANAYFSSNDSSGKTFCEVASTAARPKHNASVDCNNVIPSLTLYAVMVYSGGAAGANVLLSFIVKPFGKKRTTLLTFFISTVCGILLFFVKIPLLSIALFYAFLYVAVILGNANTYLVELNPTYLRGMATCLSVIVARGFGFMSVQLIATVLADHCTLMLVGYVALVFSGFLAAMFLPSDCKMDDSSNVNLSPK
ncbi:synaptic vesicle glycoprotein 2A-like isoform X2 [Pectinophora gossypiella]|uniref:synaptic vesicle glycoprotein 2A-like isoform X2 n=2 Tax=Pectinophora gossypiella TaxID=13191 RepID=UPI00214F207B|nr:synaptic vesicle glycoprotein 2A-like isoform X2 [Pectinophora gossypiella]